MAPYAIEKVQGARTGFIGMTLEETPEIVPSSGVAGLTFTDEIEIAKRSLTAYLPDSAAVATPSTDRITVVS